MRRSKLGNLENPILYPNSITPYTPQTLNPSPPSDEFDQTLKKVGVYAVGGVATVCFVALAVKGVKHNSWLAKRKKIEVAAAGGHKEANSAIQLAQIFKNSANFFTQLGDDIRQWFENVANSLNPLSSNIEKVNTNYELARQVAAKIATEKQSVTKVKELFLIYTKKTLEDYAAKVLAREDLRQFLDLLNGKISATQEDFNESSTMNLPEPKQGQSVTTNELKGSIVYTMEESDMFVGSNVATSEDFSEDPVKYGIPKAAVKYYWNEAWDNIVANFPIGYATGKRSKNDDWGTDHTYVQVIAKTSKGTFTFWIDEDSVGFNKSKSVVKEIIENCEWSGAVARLNELQNPFAMSGLELEEAQSPLQKAVFTLDNILG